MSEQADQNDRVERARIVVFGKVQGVYFRASTQERAQALNLTGWVRNLAGGGVEIEAEGSRRALEDLLAWCSHGPPDAVVERIESDFVKALGEHQTFRIENTRP